jgi:hypothetical protein
MTTTALAAGPKPLASRWIGASFAGWSAGFVLSILFLVGVESIGIRNTQFPLALGMGFGVGFMQARLLGPRLGGRWKWVLASSAGLAAPFLLMDLFRLFGIAVPFSLAAYVGIGGIVAGALQAGLLRSITSRAGRWLPPAAAAWILAGSTVLIADRLELPGVTGIAAALMFVAIVLLGGVVLGGIQAVALHRILETPEREAASTSRKP